MPRNNQRKQTVNTIIILAMIAAFAAVITYRVCQINRLFNDLEQHLEDIRNQGCSFENNKEKENK